MTWVLYRREHDGNHDYKEWSDSEIEQAAKEVKESLTPLEEFGTIDETELHEAIDIVQQFLPTPLREAL